MVTTCLGWYRTPSGNRIELYANEREYLVRVYPGNGLSVDEIIVGPDVAGEHYKLATLTGNTTRHFPWLAKVTP